MQFIGAPPQPDLLFQLQAQAGAIVEVERVVLLQLLDQGRHPPLLMAHGMAHDFGGVGRKYQADVEFAQELLELGRR